jgi:hypothetical protein
MRLLSIRFTIRRMMIAVAVLGLPRRRPSMVALLVPVAVEAGHDHEVHKPGRNDECR